MVGRVGAVEGRWVSFGTRVVFCLVKRLVDVDFWMLMSGSGGLDVEVLWWSEGSVFVGDFRFEFVGVGE